MQVGGAVLVITCGAAGGSSTGFKWNDTSQAWQVTAGAFLPCHVINTYGTSELSWLLPRLSLLLLLLLLFAVSRGVGAAGSHQASREAIRGAAAV
jgi:hypothetical protein